MDTVGLLADVGNDATAAVALELELGECDIFEVGCYVRRGAAAIKIPRWVLLSVRLGVLATVCSVLSAAAGTIIIPKMSICTMMLSGKFPTLLYLVVMETKSTPLFGRRAY